MSPAFYPSGTLRRGLLMMAVLGLAASTSSADGTSPAPATPPIPATQWNDRVVSWFVIGASSTNVDRRRVGWGLARSGWAGFIRHRVRPQIRQGVRRIILHNPFGSLPDEPMQFDQYIHARNAQLPWLTEGFVEAWKPITSGEEGPKVEVIAYLGKLEGDPDFDALLEQGKPDEWLMRAWLSVWAPLRAGMPIGLDSAGVADRDSMTYRFAELLRGMGVRVYIEPRPDDDKPHWYDYPIITTDKHWRRSNPGRFGDAKHKASNDQLTGEIIRIIRPQQAPKDQDQAQWLLEQARGVRAADDTVAIPVYLLQNTGVPFAEVERGEDEKPPSENGQ